MSIKVITNDNFNAEVIEAGRPVLVEFWAPWCVYCKRLTPVLSRLSAKLGDGLSIASVNVDEQPELAERFGASVIPTLYLFQNGTHGEKLVAPSSQTQIEEWIKEQGGEIHGQAI